MERRVVTTTVYLVRHGETGQTVSGVTSDITKQGRLDLFNIGKKLTSENIRLDIAVFSDLKRCMQSIDALFEGGGAFQSGCKKIADPRLNEKDFAKLIGSNLSETVKKKYSQNSYIPECEPDVIKSFGCESTKSVFKRVLKAFKHIKRKNKDKIILILCSGGTSTMFQCCAIGMKNYKDYLAEFRKDGGKLVESMVLARGEYKKIIIK